MPALEARDHELAAALAHIDASMAVGDGVIVGSMRYTVRWTEEILMKPSDKCRWDNSTRSYEACGTEGSNGKILHHLWIVGA